MIVHLDHGTAIQTPKRIIIHSMGEFIGEAGWQNHAVQYLDKVGLSAHSIIAPDGVNYRCRDDNQGAYHALGHNTDTLGLEFLVEGVHTYSSFLKAISQPYLTAIQYEIGVEQVKYWIKHWGITEVLRHSDISPERKVDPGDGYPWAMFKKDIGL
jgi:N-acetyl-anhydromuramyl-L-alanine amidase AmpD